ncbi:hypothetical protein Krac_11763 [Ktedonobacter racemifer DSM 44963]|uniref:Uncharacterized protein n=1 Tax=Ktedonobacter racemifer DSM 44963 TaxID=485913 RepID=D6TDM3_KTERA|nr:hypothetical protein Krac_11763 [Ktedonobacter racemifer DSM 44963]
MSRETASQLPRQKKREDKRLNANLRRMPYANNEWNIE